MLGVMKGKYDAANELRLNRDRRWLSGACFFWGTVCR